MRPKFFLISKIAIGISLAIFFVLNSWYIFKNYTQGKTVTSRSVTINQKGKQLLPAIIICREKAYNAVQNMYKLDDFLSNTMKLHYAIRDEEYNPVEENSTKLKRQHVYSATRGHCIVLKYTKEVEPFKELLLYLYPTYAGVNENLMFHMVEWGEEIFLHHALWRNVPLTFRMDGNTETMDIALTKVVEEMSVGDCISDEDYSYTGCLRQEFKEYSTVGKTYDLDGDEYTYPNCTMSWHQSMLGILKYNDSEVEVCNQYDAGTLYELDYFFLRKASQMTTRCKGSCHTNKYEGRALVFQQDPDNIWFPPPTDNGTYHTNYTSSANGTSNSNSPNSPIGEKFGRRFLFVYYTTADETVFSSDRLIDFPSFISSVGGNLGLFLGFSFLGVLVDFLDKIEAFYQAQFG